MLHRFIQGGLPSGLPWTVGDRDRPHGGEQVIGVSQTHGHKACALQWHWGSALARVGPDTGTGRHLISFTAQKLS